MKVGAKGQVVIPKAVREELHIQPGDEVIVDSVDGEARVRRHADLPPLLGLLADGPGSVGMEGWEAAKREERELEERKWARMEADFRAARERAG